MEKKDEAQLEIANFFSFHKLIEFHMSFVGCVERPKHSLDYISIVKHE
jgi:hypothetical protein